LRGDASLRRRLDNLLRAHDQAGSFLLESPAGPGEVAGEGRGLLAEGAGSSVGPYRLLEQIGEGGMGTVFRAEQTEPVAREVAVKIIKLGLDTRPVVAPVRAERQALAMMDHPNIAKVLDAGSTGVRLPVLRDGAGQGRADHRVLRRTSPDARERLELFILVCQAVQHAHQKGIIHRDLKPANVLVARYDGKPVPKVIDFGLAKATGRS
jgi:serine/threonine protein kinase